MNCIVCQSNDLAEIYRTTNLNFYKCCVCGVMFKKKMPTIEELVKIYNDFYVFDKNNLVSTTMETNKNVLKNYAKYILNNNKKIANILDIGCGTGVFLNEIRYIDTDIILEGLEFNENARKVANQIFTVYEEFTQVNNKYDLITMIEVIEHLTDPKKFIEGLYCNLNENGKLLITTPNINSLKSIIRKEHYSEINKPFHLVLFSETSLKILLKNAGFKEIQFIKYTPFFTKTIVETAKMKLLQSLNLYGGLFVIAKK